MQKKRFVGMVLAGALAVTACFAPAAQADDTQEIMLRIGSPVMRIDQKDVTMDTVPLIKHDRTYVPIRAVAEGFGADVEYDEKTQDVTFSLEDKQVKMNLKATVFTVNEQMKLMSVAPYINADNRTMVPVRFATEGLGFQVEAKYNTDGTTAAVAFSRK